jgi:hypothetical protein
MSGAEAHGVDRREPPAPGGLTVLRCAGAGCNASKRWQWNPTLGQWRKIGYSAGASFYAEEHALANLRELADLLEQVQRDPLAFIVRGQLTAAALELVAADKPILRRKLLRGTTLPTLAEVPRQWIMIDVDGWPLPAWPIWWTIPEASLKPLSPICCQRPFTTRNVFGNSVRAPALCQTCSKCICSFGCPNLLATRKSRAASSLSSAASMARPIVPISRSTSPRR